MKSARQLIKVPVEEFFFEKEMARAGFPLCPFLRDFRFEGSLSGLDAGYLGESGDLFAGVEFDEGKEGIAEKSFVEGALLRERFANFKQNGGFAEAEGELNG